MEIEASINEIDKKIAESQRNEEVYELRKKRTALEHFRLENLPFAERRKEIITSEKQSRKKMQKVVK